MNKLKIIFCILLLSATTLFANEEKSPNEVHDTRGYFSIGVGFPSIISLDLGTRIQHNHNGFDVGIGVTPLILIIEGHLYANYLLFPKPNLDSQYYFGIGAKVGVGALTYKWNKHLGYVTPQILIGKEYLMEKNEKRFIQASLGGAYFTTKGNKFLPTLQVSYGIIF
ncbi:MAG: hypothetical protein K1060chlam2_00315 [Chlamydiae bacterium]|nr:hypothetical protein [Chlamydiota bacterium]